MRGYKAGTQTVHSKPGGKDTLQVTLAPLEVEPALVQATESAPPVEAEPVKPAAASSSGPPTTALWVTGGIGVAGLVTGSVLGFLALKEHSKFDSHPTDASADRGERLALFADVGFGVGALAIVTAAVLYFTYDDKPDSDSDASSARLTLTPVLSPSTAAASARLRF